MAAFEQKIVVVTRKTRLEQLVERQNTRGQARFEMVMAFQAAANDADPERIRRQAEAEFASYEAEDATYQQARTKLLAELKLGVPVQVIDRSFVPSYVFGPNDVVVTLGQDGLVANTAKYALQQPIVGVNPDPERIDGVLLPFHVEQSVVHIADALRGRARVQEVTLAEARLNDGQLLLAFNDLFIGAKSHVSARYRLQVGQQSEDQSSSGVLVSTGAGSSGWLSSTFNMSAGVFQTFGGGPAERSSFAPVRLPWDARELIFVVREPFVSRTSAASLVAGRVPPNGKLTIESHMPQAGVIFSDGIEQDFIAFTAGAIATIRASDRRAKLVVEG